MIAVIILMLMFSLGIAAFATENTAGVVVKIFGMTWSSTPLYVIVIGSLLIGLLIGWGISMFNTLTNSITLRNKEAEIKDSKKTIADLTRRVHHLEVENSRLKDEHPEEKPTVHEERSL
jgi:uncharacterized integral membrane protein